MNIVDIIQSIDIHVNFKNRTDEFDRIDEDTIILQLNI